MRIARPVLLGGLAFILAPSLALAAGSYPRTDWVADMPVGAHIAEGFATIVDERTIRVDHFSYDGTAPAVYFYLGASESHFDLAHGIPIGPLLDRAYNDETIVVQLPEGQTIDGYAAISVWCEAFNVNFSSATFVCAADFDGDGVVGLSDLATLLASYGATSGAELSDGDLDGDADVDLDDLASLLSAYGTICNPTLTMSFTGLEDLGPDYVYEGWLIVGGAPVSTGRFTIDGAGVAFPGWFAVDAQDAADATLFVLTIEPAVGDDPAPSDTHVLAGDLVAGAASLTIGHAAALGDDFSTAAGAFILETPTTASTPGDYDQGIWWLDPGAGPGPTLVLPTLPAGWEYEGWVVSGSGPLSTGRFLTASGADSDGAGPDAGPDAAPPFPGQDFISPAQSLIGYAAVISVEPSPDNSPEPFALKPLVDSNIEDIAPPTTQSAANNAAAAPTGTVTIE